MNATLTALAEPNRRRIVELLKQHPRPVNDLVQELGLPQPLVSKHLRALRDAGMVRVRRNAQQRVYELNPLPFRELDTWVESFRRLWEQRLDSLEGFLEEEKRHPKPRAK